MAPIKPNAFLCFMLEQKPFLEKQHGRKILMNELPELLNFQWTNMPRHLKEKYSYMSNKTKSKNEKMDSRGIPLRKIEDEKNCAEKEEEDMKREIYLYVSSISNEKESGITNQNLYIVSIQIYGRLVNKKILPAEIGLVKFNFKKGIISEFHKIIKAKIPDGYFHEISVLSMTTHNLFDNINHAALKGIAIEGEYVAEELKKYLYKENNEAKNNIILFTPRKQREIVRSFLECDSIKIYSLDILYMEMYNITTTVGESDIPVSIADDHLNDSLYDFNPNPACFFHQKYIEDNSKYCALSEAKRYCYNMCMHMNIKTRFDIEPVIGRHLPGNLRSGERVSCILPPQVLGFKTTNIDDAINKSKGKNVHNMQSPEWIEDSVSENLDNLSLISDVTESSTSVFLPHVGMGNEGIPAGINLLRGAWASPSTVSSVKTEDESEFPTLGASPYRQDFEGRSLDALYTNPNGVLKQSLTQSNVGLQGFGRGKTFLRRMNN